MRSRPSISSKATAKRVSRTTRRRATNRPGRRSRRRLYKVRELLLVNEERVPEDAAILVIAGPQKDILPAELEKIRRYVDGGGSVLFLLDPLLAPEISKHLQGYGFKVGNDIIIDKQSKMLGANYLTPVVMEYNQKHMIGRDFSFVTFFPVARSIEVQEEPAKGKYNLAKTGSSSWAKSKGELDEEEIKFNPAEDQRGPINLAAVSVIKVENSENLPLAEVDSRVMPALRPRRPTSRKGSTAGAGLSWSGIRISPATPISI